VSRETQRRGFQGLEGSGCSETSGDQAWGKISMFESLLNHCFPKVMSSMLTGGGKRLCFLFSTSEKVKLKAKSR
jgi:hypothetical protein